MRLLLFTCVWLFAVGRLCATIIYVPGDSGTIQAGIDGAAPGDTVHIGTGTFAEHIVIDKPIAVVGSGANATTIDGSGTGDVVRTSSDHVVISRLSLTNARSGQVEDSPWDAGIHIISSDSCRIEYCRMHDNGASGLSLTFSRNTSNTHCEIAGNECGIYFYEDWQITPVFENSDNVIMHNHIVNNSSAGIGFRIQPRHTIRRRPFRVITWHSMAAA